MLGPSDSMATMGNGWALVDKLWVYRNVLRDDSDSTRRLQFSAQESRARQGLLRRTPLGAACSGRHTGRSADDVAVEELARV